MDEDYRFPEEDNSTPGYIEVRNANFNAMGRTTTQGVEGAKTSDGSNRRSVTLKSAAPKPRYAGASSRARPTATGSASTNDVACRETPGFAPADDGEDSLSFALAEFDQSGAVLDLEETPRQVQNKRGPDTNTGGPETSKRQKKPSTKAQI